jgi:hypothetical protein
MSVRLAWAHKVAEAREGVHRDDPSTRRLTPHTHLSGMQGEFAFAELCGIMPDTSVKPSGDGGVDFRVPLMYTVDVKSRNYRNGDIDLLVEHGKVDADIYVLAVIREDDVDLRGWEWGTVVKRLPLRDLGTGVMNHWKRSDELRPMSELVSRFGKMK